ncbi:MAG: hypothetical protein ABFD90_08515 [Phycisphaerales bacterium]
MKPCNRHLINILSTGLLVMFLTLVGLFWARWCCHLLRLVAVQEEVWRVQISPTGLFPFEREDDPNLESPSSAAAQFYAVAGPFAELGAVKYVESHIPEGPGSNVYRWETEENGLRFYYDPSLCLLVRAERSDVRDPNGTTRRRYVTRFAGPEGMGETPDERLGRFTSPICDRFDIDPQMVYDGSCRCFFAIHWRDTLVRKGPKLTEKDASRPVQIGDLLKNPLVMSLTQRDSLYRQRGGDGLQPGSSRREFHAQLLQMDSWPRLVLNASGRIDLLDPGTLTLRPGVGSLPTPPTVFQHPRPAGPEDVAAFSVCPVSVYLREAEKKWAYAGCVAAAASGDLTGLQLEVFDPNGRSVATQGMAPSPDEAYFSLPGASLLSIVQFGLENLHPLTSLMLSSLTASQVPATSAQRSLILLPNSFAAMAARDTELGRVTRLASSLLFMLPAIGLGIILGWRVSRDAIRMGLSKRANTLWVLGVFALGLPAYITYRLTQPKVSLVTCGSCGLGRRTDFEKCQRCGASWVVPELTPPAWRVLGEPEQAEEVSPSPAEETGSPAKEV